MPDSKITDLTELTTLADGDLFVTVDVSDTTQSPSGTDKKITKSNLLTPANVGLGNVTNNKQIYDSNFPASSVDSDFVMFSGTTGKSVKDNSLSLDTDGTLAANSDTKIPSQKSVKTYVDTKASTEKADLTKYSNLYAPEGFLINGKIVPSVASNNLTVAIKGMDGNDPSATNPVYCRINSVIRSITSALSVTKNAGTNWFNSGGTTLAANEIDYFVYLGYNATDGVVIGFSRITYAKSYDDFSTTTTNGRYAAISTITNATATDYYNVIGRFAATLSGGAGYTWTVPTYTAKNLIQRPIYETRTLAFIPGLSGFSGTPTYNYAVYKMFGDEMKTIVNGITGTSNATTLSVGPSLSFISTTNYANGDATSLTDNSVASTAHGRCVANASTGIIDVYTNGATGAWTAANTKGASIDITYPLNIAW